MKNYCIVIWFGYLSTVLLPLQAAEPVPRPHFLTGKTMASMVDSIAPVNGNGSRFCWSAGISSIDNTSYTVGRFSTDHLNRVGASVAAEYSYLPWSSARLTFNFSQLDPDVLQQGDKISSIKNYSSLCLTNPLTHIANGFFRSSVVVGPAWILVGDGVSGYNSVVSAVFGLENQVRLGGSIGTTLGIYYLRHANDEWVGKSHGQVSLFLDYDERALTPVNLWRDMGRFIGGLFRSGEARPEGAIPE